MELTKKDLEKFLSSLLIALGNEQIVQIDKTDKQDIIIKYKNKVLYIKNEGADLRLVGGD
jgi:hypothetical protein